MIYELVELLAVFVYALHYVTPRLEVFRVVDNIIADRVIDARDLGYIVLVFLFYVEILL